MVKGVHKETGAIHAIKIVEWDCLIFIADIQVDKNSTDAKEMSSELKVMSKLVHPNIVNFKEVFDHEDGFYVVLE